jgi:uncharacterized spore protein YtfJ
MDVMQMVEKAKDAASVNRVFGEPITQNGVTIIPVARVGGGAGGGDGKQEGDRPSEGSGGGFGVGGRPAGTFVINEGKVSWKPAVDVNRVIVGGQLVAIIALLTIRTIAKLRAKSAS